MSEPWSLAATVTAVVDEATGRVSFGGDVDGWGQFVDGGRYVSVEVHYGDGRMRLFSARDRAGCVAAVFTYAAGVAAERWRQDVRDGER